MSHHVEVAQMVERRIRTPRTLDGSHHHPTYCKPTKHVHDTWDDGSGLCVDSQR